MPFRWLPDDLLAYYEGLLHEDKREPFPRKLLYNLRWPSPNS